MPDILLKLRGRNPCLGQCRGFCKNIPRHRSHFSLDVFQHTFANIIDTKFYTWGFLIYRRIYDDDGLWHRYLTQLKTFAHNYLVEERRAELLEQDIGGVVEGRATLNNASRLDVRQHFNLWVS
ncbi:hypothetical protein ColTof4_04792 [Colletotrichum tofieldiae]|nr:hypothetical protein ColTof3_10960 [Colletotrichum tofieldiae]GKT72369.1 hypothetical protein ColTof4_04792 [Colletotrichum tofieldiae]GKT89806.1 hypothetical protein Ct61P_07656 [Colletotrichum tofieldiae]